MALIGIMAGSAVIGRLSDRYGYLLLFRLCPVVCGLSALCVVLFPHLNVLLPMLFVMGFAVGGEYSLDPDYISELMPARWKEFMVGVAKALSSMGSAIVALVCLLMLTPQTQAAVWSRMMWIVVVLCAVMFLSRLPFAQSPAWLIVHGQRRQAGQAVKKMLGKNVEIGEEDFAKEPERLEKQSFAAFVRKRLRDVILTGVPWACEGLGVYGIGIFLPVLIMSLGIDTLPLETSPMGHVTASVRLTFVMCVVMAVGFAAGLCMVKRLSHFKMQVWGFVASGAGLLLLLAAYLLKWPSWIALTGLAVFELTLNAGPHLITFILPSEIYSVSDRGTGAGIAASVGKTGAVLGAFFIPVVLRHFGAGTVIAISAAAMFAGAAVTSLLRVPR